MKISVRCLTTLGVLLVLASPGRLNAVDAPPKTPPARNPLEPAKPAGETGPAAESPARVTVDEGEALLRDWAPPEYPESARLAKAEGTVLIQFVVELDGSVTRASVVKSSDAQFDAAALAAVQRWVFTPAISKGQPAVSAMRVPVVFKRARLGQKKSFQPPQEELPAALPMTGAKMKESPNPTYPQELADRQLSGVVHLEFTVGTDGIAHAPKILWTSHAAFVGPALAALADCRFEPAHQGPLLHTQLQQAPMEFESLGVNRASVLEANHITVAMKENLDVLPSPQVLIEPVHPLTPLLAAESGSATVEFTLDARGNIQEPGVKSATQPEYGAALLTAVETWRFSPARKEGQSVPASLQVTHDFSPPAGGPVGRLVDAMRPGGPGVGGAKGLDGKLVPLWRGFPVYPSSLRAERPAGKAVIEFVIDRDGRVRLPRVVSATHEAFGWAAATALSQWVFEPPQRQGNPTEIRVSIPVDFTPPAE